MRTAIFSLGLLPEDSKIDINKISKNITAVSIHNNKEHKLLIPINLCDAENSDKLKIIILHLVNKLFEEKDYYLAPCEERCLSTRNSQEEVLINKALNDYKHCQQYGTVVKSPTGIVHVIENDESTITLCGQKFIINDGSNWEIEEDYFFGPDNAIGIGEYSITCKKCRALETKRMRLEIIKEKDY